MAGSTSTHVEIANLGLDCDSENDDVNEDSSTDSHCSDDEYEIQHKEESEMGGSDDSNGENADSDEECYISRSQEIFWNKTLPLPGHTPIHNSLKSDNFGLPVAGINANSIKDCFQLFISMEMKNIIIKNTNEKGKSVYFDKWKDTDAREIDAFLGLLILAGVFHSKNEDIQELWSEVIGRPHFKATMNLTRFKELMRCIRFDDIKTRTARQKNDRMAAIRDYFAKFVESCKTCYIPNSNVTVDEQFYPWRGKVKKLKIYMPSNPAKYGLKFWILADAISYFCLNIQLYLGKEEVPQVRQGAKVIFDLASHLFESNRNITCGNQFTDYKLAQDLLKNHMTILGTLHKSQTDVPQEFLPNNRRQIFSSLFGFSNNVTLASFVPKVNRALVTMSTMHQGIELAEEQRKPIMMIDYNKTKSAVKLLDKLIGTYSVKRKIKRWPMVVFFNILDLASYNAFVIWISLNPGWNHNKKYCRRLFLVELGTSLVTPHILHRIETSKICVQRRSLKRAIESVGIDITSCITPCTSKEFFPRKRCHICPPARDRKSRIVCEKCYYNVCGEHSKKITICNQCFANVADTNSGSSFDMLSLIKSEPCDHDSS